jgi:hypothetical protein
VVRDVWRARATGILHLSSGATAKKIFFKSGEIVFAATNEERERLGERLVRAGRIKRSIVDLACRVMERSHQRFGKTIVEWGWVSPAEIQYWIAEQIKDIVYSVFSWSSGDYRFEPAEEPVEPDLLLELHTAEVIWEGARRIGNLDAIRVGVGDPKGSLALAGGSRLGIPVGQNEGYILARVDGQTTISEILSSSPLEEEDTLRCIYALLLAGVLERMDSLPSSQDPSEASKDSLGGQPVKGGAKEDDARRFRDAVVARYAAMQFGNLYDRLGVDVGASTQDIRKAYHEVIQSLEPEPHYKDQIQDLKRRLDKVRRKVIEAHDVLTDRKRRRAYDRSIGEASPDSTLAHGSPPQAASPEMAATLASQPMAAPEGTPQSSPSSESAVKKKEAEAHYADGRVRMAAGQYFDAVAALDEAVRLDPDKGEYHRVLAQLLSQNPSCSRASQEHFERAIELDPDDKEAYRGLANLLEQNGLTERARRILEKVTTIEQNHGNARKANATHK